VDNRGEPNAREHVASVALGLGLDSDKVPFTLPTFGSQKRSDIVPGLRRVLTRDQMLNALPCRVGDGRPLIDRRDVSLRLGLLVERGAGVCRSGTNVRCCREQNRGSADCRQEAVDTSNLLLRLGTRREHQDALSAHVAI
jgi:hypothetical protein